MARVQTNIHFDEKTWSELDADCAAAGLSRSEGVNFLANKLLASRVYIIGKDQAEDVLPKAVYLDYEVMQQLDDIGGDKQRSALIREAYRRYKDDLRALKAEDKGVLHQVILETTQELIDKVDSMAVADESRSAVIRRAVVKLIENKDKIREIKKTPAEVRRKIHIYSSEVKQLQDLQKELKDSLGVKPSRHDLINLAIERM